MQNRQTKTHSSDTTKKTAETPQKADIKARDATRVPAWANANSSSINLQTKLTVNEPGDIYEQEADRVADQVMRMPNPSATIQRKCACGGTPGSTGECEECAKKRMALQRKSSQSSSDTTSPAIVNSVLSSSSTPMDASTRSFMEPRFGYDFSDVRIHTDSQAAESAQAVNALAYTVGSDVVFGERLYRPETNEGQKLLAHELMHVVQQGHSKQSSIQRFASEEHTRIGDMTVGTSQTIDIGTEVGPISYGEMIALSGDYFESVAELRGRANDIYGRDEVLFALWKVNPSRRSRPVVSQSTEDAVMDRYYRLAARNETHFSTGSAAGRSNRERYIQAHIEAIGAAYSQGRSRIQSGGPWQAREAFANHFLTDAFSAGHIRTPRGQIQEHWQRLYPKFPQSLVQMISCYMASYINDRDNIGYIATVDQLAQKIAEVVQNKAGTILSSYSIGDLLSKVMHDADNAGLDVMSPRGPAGSVSSSPFRWRAVGDEFLFKNVSDSGTQQAQMLTQKMVTEAVMLSYQETQQVASIGYAASPTLTELTNPANFRALSLIPTENTAATNPTYDWRVSSIRALPSNLHKFLVDVFASGTEIRKGLDDLAIDPITSTVLVGITFDLHTGEAWNCFKSILLADPFEAIAKIAEGNVCPPGKNNPCSKSSSPATTSPASRQQVSSQ